MDSHYDDFVLHLSYFSRAARLNRAGTGVRMVIAEYQAFLRLIATA
jgi:hypothetical protein